MSQRLSHTDAGGYVQVRWEDTSQYTRHPTGSNGRFELTPYERGVPRQEPRVRDAVVEAALTWQRLDPKRAAM